MWESSGMEIGAAGFSDIAIVRRGLVQSAQCANAEGLVAGLCPGGESYMASYALQWVPACLNYMRLTGDRTLLTELYDAAERNIAAFDPYLTEEGITSCPYWNFIDWGYVPNEGNSDMALNLHYMIAVQTMARWADLMDRPERAQFYRERAEQFGRILETYYAQNDYDWGTHRLSPDRSRTEGRSDSRTASCRGNPVHQGAHAELFSEQSAGSASERSGGQQFAVDHALFFALRVPVLV